MPLQILSEPPPEPEALCATLEAAIVEALPGAQVTVRAAGPGHYEIDVVCEAFEGLPRVKQQQRVYAAIAKYMSGDQAPVHAVDRMVTRTA